MKQVSQNKINFSGFELSKQTSIEALHAMTDSAHDFPAVFNISKKSGVFQATKLSTSNTSANNTAMADRMTYEMTLLDNQQFGKTIISITFKPEHAVKYSSKFYLSSGLETKSIPIKISGQSKSKQI